MARLQGPQALGRSKGRGKRLCFAPSSVQLERSGSGATAFMASRRSGVGATAVTNISAGWRNGGCVRIHRPLPVVLQQVLITGGTGAAALGSPEKHRARLRALGVVGDAVELPAAAGQPHDIEPAERPAQEWLREGT